VYNLFAECRTGSGNNHSGLCIVDPGSFVKVWPVARSILVAMIVKGGLTIITFGIKVPCGIFIPTLGVGACVGRVVGIAMQWLQINYPTLQMFEACRGDADCKSFASAFLRILLDVFARFRYRPGIVCDGRSCCCIVWRDSGSKLLHHRLLTMTFTTLANNCFIGRYHVRTHRYLDLRCPCHVIGARCQDCC
jgi:hypothetical protein